LPAVLGELTALHQTPLVGFKGSTSKVRGGEREERRGKLKRKGGGEGRGKRSSLSDFTI